MKFGLLNLLTALSLMAAPTALRAANLHVAPTGDDACTGTASHPLRTITRAATSVQPGDVVRIHTGIYRQNVTIAASGTPERPICFQAEPGATVVITGADPLTGWTPQADGACSVPWPHRLFQGNEHNPGGCEQVFVGDCLLLKVLNLTDLTESGFFVDHQRLFLRSAGNPDQAPRPVEASTRSNLWIVTGAHIQTRGLHFRYAANVAQHGMAQFRGAAALVEDCTFEWSNSTGANFLAPDITVRHCIFQLES